MTNIFLTIESIENALEKLHENMNGELECKIEQTNNETILYADKSALIHIARRIMTLARKDFSGAHFTIDKADIAIDSETALTIALKDFKKGL